MPTDIQPDNPNATGAGRLQAMVNGPRDPGSPMTAGKPAPTPGKFSYPAPPAPATAPVGRPPTPAPAPLGARAAGARPSQPGTPAPGAPAPAAQPAPAAATPPTQPGSSPSAPSAGSSVTPGVAPPAAPEAAPGPGGNTFGAPMPTSPNIPTPGSLAPGASVQTPYGVASTDPATGQQKLALDAAGQQKYKESVAALRSKLTVPKVMKGMQGLPQMELKLGASNFDPFSGRFHGKE